MRCAGLAWGLGASLGTSDLETIGLCFGLWCPLGALDLVAPKNPQVGTRKIEFRPKSLVGRAASLRVRSLRAPNWQWSYRCLIWVMSKRSTSFGVAWRVSLRMVRPPSGRLKWPKIWRIWPITPTQAFLPICVDFRPKHMHILICLWSVNSHARARARYRDGLALSIFGVRVPNMHICVLYVLQACYGRGK